MATFHWSEAAKRHADYHRRQHLEIEDWPRMIPMAEAVAHEDGKRRVTVECVEEACRLIRDESPMEGHYERSTKKEV